MLERFKFKRVFHIFLSLVLLVVFLISEIFGSGFKLRAKAVWWWYEESADKYTIDGMNFYVMVDMQLIVLDEWSRYAEVEAEVIDLNEAIDTLLNFLHYDIDEWMLEINSGAFDSLPNLKKIIFPFYREKQDFSYMVVDSGAIKNCQSLTELEFYDCRTDFEGGWIVNCPNIERIYIHCPEEEPADIGYYGSCDGFKKLFEGNYNYCDNLQYDSCYKGVTYYLDGNEIYIDGIYDSKITNGVIDFNVLISEIAQLNNVEIDFNNIHFDRYAFYGNRQFFDYYPEYYRFTLTLPDGMKEIPDSLFRGNQWIYEVTIPDTVEKIDDSAFYGCSRLTSITIPDGVTSISDYTFCRCSRLTSITIPEGVTSISNYAFSGCSRLTSITIPEGVTSIGWHAFSDCSSLTSITIPDTVTSIGDAAFSFCSGLTSITIPDTVTSIGDAAFCGCSDLTDIVIPDGVESIGWHTFYSCSNLKSFTIPESVTKIGQYAFENCTSLTSINIPDSVTSIGRGAFSGCSRLTSITIPESVTSMEFDAFGGYNQGDKIEYVFYKGSKEQWDRIYIDSGIVKQYDWYYDEDTNMYYGTTNSEYDYNALRDAYIHYNVTDEMLNSPYKGHTYSWTVTKEPAAGEAGLREGRCQYCDSVIEEEIPMLEPEQPSVITIEAEDYLNDAAVAIKIIDSLETPVVAGFDKGEELEFAFDVPAEGYYNTSIFTSKKYAGNSVFNLMENGKVIAKFTTASTGSLNTFAETAGPRVYLTAGEHNVTLAAMHSNTYVDKFVFTPFVPCEPSAHVAGEWTVVTEPTTSRKGLRTSVCTVCGEEITEIIPRIYQSVSVIEAEDYTNDAEVTLKNIAGVDTLVVTAFDKNESLEFTFTIDKDDYYDTSIFTSRKYAGNAVFTLSENGEAIAKFTTAPTGDLKVFAETAGPRIYLTAGEHRVELVSNNGNTYVDRLVFTPFVPCEPSAHVAGEWTVVTEPTTSREGLRTSVCTVCGEELTESIPRIYQSVSVIEAEDYTNDAEVTLKNIAGIDTPVVTAYDKNESLEFTFTIEKDDYYDTSIFTSRKYAGNAVFTLSENGEVIAKFTTAPTGDLKVFAETAGPRIYLTAGEHRVELVSNNGNTYVDKLVFTPFVPCDPSAHVAGEWTVTLEPTTSREGVQTTYCTVCGEELTESISRIYQSISVIEAEDYVNDAPVTIKKVSGIDTPVVSGIDRTDEMEYIFTVEKSGYYSVNTIASRKSTGNSTLLLKENNVEIAALDIASTGANSIFADNAGPRIYLRKGTHTVVLYAKTGGCYLDKIVFTPES